MPTNGSTNILLSCLSPETRNRLLTEIETVPLAWKQVLQQPGEPMSYVYFPSGGFCSLVTVLSDGRMVEVATIGREGIVGLPSALNGTAATAMVIVQGEIEFGYRISAMAFRREMRRNEEFAEVVTAYLQAMVAFAMQSTACNALHSIEQRFSRWLLLAQDRMLADHFRLTQEFAAMMLGASRPMVTLVAGLLQRRGLITYERGHVTVVDRAGLEKSSCECYRVVKTLLDNVHRC